ncbi:MAG: ABC transporter substrate-binding protein, partial [Gemmatimonadaceae bacterium]
MRTRMFWRGSVAAAMAVVQAGCEGPKAGDQQGTDGGALIVAAPIEAETLLPPIVESVAAKSIVDLLYDHLAEPGTDLNTVGSDGYAPRGADSWEWSSDSSAITFHLNPKGRFHDGHPVRSADVAFSYDLTADPVVASFVRTNFPPIESVTTPDSLSVRFNFSNRSPERFYQLTSNLWILPKHLLDTLDRKQIRTSAVGRNPVGSGPFRFSRWDARSVIEIVANTDYHLGRPHLDRVVFAYSNDLSTAATRVAAGEADFVEQVRVETVGTLTGKPFVRFEPYGSYTNGYLLYNLHDRANRAKPHPILGDRAMRLALSMAIDRRGAVKSVY